jgi:hypothetical protein
MLNRCPGSVGRRSMFSVKPDFHVEVRTSADFTGVPTNMPVA